MFFRQPFWKKAMIKEILYRGKKLEELKDMGYSQLANHLKARARRVLKRGLNDQQKKLLEQVKSAEKGRSKPIKTHCRDMIVLPEMVGHTFHIYSGQKFNPVEINVEMLGRYLGEFVLTRKEVSHKAPGVGATKGTKHASVK
jgi:small subunit ribosomal protein S19